MQKVHSMLNVFVFLTAIAFFIYFFTIIDSTTFSRSQISRPGFKYFISSSQQRTSDYNLWLIFTKVVEQTPLYYNFYRLIENIFNVSSIPLNLHVITDVVSKQIAIEIINKLQVNEDNSKVMSYKFYNVTDFASSIKDIVDVMTPYFSSTPGTYYSDALFYISLGLYRLAPIEQKLAVMIDCDVHFRQDVSLLFEQFQEEGELFALAPELSPVYRHILYPYKLKHNTTFGEYLHPKPISMQNIEAPQYPNGLPGYNSGVILFNLTAIRSSIKYRQEIKKESVKAMVSKYHFRGHLGDQDFYTLLGYEHPEMIRMLSCAFNRQLCTWWGDNGGYKDIFDKYFECKDDIVLLHGNCNSKIPS